jgi:serine protease Do
MTRKILSLLLILVTVISVSSCAILDGTILPGANPSDKTNGNGGSSITLNGGDTNNITISTDSELTAAAASKALLSAVSVYCNFERITFFGTTEVTSGGAGVIYKLDKESGDAYVITNYHVVYDASSTTKNRISDDISIYLYGLEATKYEIPATYVGGSMSYDIAILKVDSNAILTQSSAVSAAVASSDDVSVLDLAIAIGNPELRGLSATVGHVNVDSEEINLNMTTPEGISAPIKLRVMRTDAAVNAGNSGGGLFNIKGELIGIVNAKRAVDDIDNIGYAIPSNLVRMVADNIIFHCADKTNENLKKATLGIKTAAFESDVEYDTETGEIRKSETTKITEVSEGTAAYGKLSVGDVLVSISISGKEYPITRYYHTSEILLDARVGDTVTVKVIRGGQTVEATFTVSETMMTVKS